MPFVLPLHVGGAPAAEQRVHTVLRAALGVGGATVPDATETIDWLWRQARSVGIAAGSTTARRVLSEGSPRTATTLLPYYERVLGLVPPLGASEQQRREEVVALWPAKASARPADIEAELQLIDSRFSLLSFDDSLEVTTMGGRWLPSLDDQESPDFGAAASEWPAYTTRYLMRVLFAVGYDGSLIPADARRATQAKSLLRRRLPSWWDFAIVTSIGLDADLSDFDLTGADP